MFKLIGKAITGKMLWIGAGMLLSFFLVLGGLIWQLERSQEQTAVAREEAVRANQWVSQLESDLESQVAETAAAHRRYEQLGLLFLDLQARHREIRTTRQREQQHIEEAKQSDETVKAYLRAPVPGRINCLLTESCSGH